jgi:hypothetical protein
MTDAQLVEFLNIGDLSPGDQEKVLQSLTAERRALYDRMEELETELRLWRMGLGPKPTGTLIDFPRKRKPFR